MYRNAYITLLKINAMFILVLCGLGIDVSIEKRQGDILVALLVVSIVGTFVGGGATWLAAKVALKSRHVSTRWVKLQGNALCPGAMRLATSVLYQPTLPHLRMRTLVPMHRGLLSVCG
jgi:hypothetical protein